jgi:hypothetical protein
MKSKTAIAAVAATLALCLPAQAVIVDANDAPIVVHFTGVPSFTGFTSFHFQFQFGPADPYWGFNPADPDVRQISCAFGSVAQSPALT